MRRSHFFTDLSLEDEPVYYAVSWDLPGLQKKKKAVAKWKSAAAKVK